MQTRALTMRVNAGIRRLPKDGYTLIEMLVVLTIISLIVGLVGPRVLGYLGESRVKTAKLQIENLSSALDLFYIEHWSLGLDLEIIMKTVPAMLFGKGAY